MSIMSNDPFRSREYREIQRDHLFRTLAFLLENGMEFAVAAEVEYMYFPLSFPPGSGGVSLPYLFSC